MVGLRSTQRGSASTGPTSDEASIGSRRAQVNAYRDAVDKSPILIHHGDRPPEIAEASDSSEQDGPSTPSHAPPTPSYSADSIVQLLERLTRQVDDSRLAQEESVANLECRFTSFVQDSTHAPPVQQEDTSPDRTGHSSTRRNDIQHAMREEAQHSDDYRSNSQTLNLSNATPFSTTARRRQSIMTVLSPGPSRSTGLSSHYPDDDPPVPHGLQGYMVRLIELTTQVRAST
jgi:hypothetical protein